MQAAVQLMKDCDRSDIEAMLELLRACRRTVDAYPGRGKMFVVAGGIATMQPWLDTTVAELSAVQGNKFHAELAVEALRLLRKVPISVNCLRDTGIGKTLTALRDGFKKVRPLCIEIIKEWKQRCRVEIKTERTAAPITRSAAALGAKTEAPPATATVTNGARAAGTGTHQAVTPAIAALIAATANAPDPQTDPSPVSTATMAAVCDVSKANVAEVSSGGVEDQGPQPQLATLPVAPPTAESLANAPPATQSPANVPAAEHISVASSTTPASSNAPAAGSRITASTRLARNRKIWTRTRRARTQQLSASQPEELDATLRELFLLGDVLEPQALPQRPTLSGTP